MSCKYVSKNNSKIATTRANKIIKDMRKVLDKGYKFEVKAVGSNVTRTTVKTQNEYFDVDYQLILTNNSVNINKPTIVREDFLKAIKEGENKGERIEQSTSCITVVAYENGYEIDFPIIRKIDNKKQIARRNNKSETPHKNEYSWEKCKDFTKAHVTYNGFSSEMKEKVKQEVIKNKCSEKSKLKGDRKLSIHIYSEVVEKYAK